jgi:hypothetical protein
MAVAGSFAPQFTHHSSVAVKLGVIFITPPRSALSN